MKRIWSNRLLVFLLAFTLIFSGGMSSWSLVQAEGDGTTPENPILIETPEQLDDIRDELNLHYKLNADIDLEDYIADEYPDDGWEPIGESGARFTGSFVGGTDPSGNLYTISGLSIDRPDEDNVGLFGDASGAVFKNILITNATVIGKDNVGILVGSVLSDSEISYIEISGTVEGENNTGGLVGWMRNTDLSSSKSSGSVVGAEDGDYTGGLVGRSSNNSNITNSFSDSTVNGHNGVGGLVGSFGGNEAVLSNSSAVGNVSGHRGVGGLVGFSNYATFVESFASGDVTSTNQYAGGLLGWGQHTVTVEKSSATGDVQGGNATGGLVGSIQNENVISESFATGDVTTTGSNVGGLVGSSTSADGNNLIINTYATGDVDGPNHHAGGLMGTANNVEIINSFALGKVTGNMDLGGLVGNPVSETTENSYWNVTVNDDPNLDNGVGEGITEAELQDPDTFTDWDNAVWGLYDGEYPYLRFTNPVVSLDIGHNYYKGPFDSFVMMPGEMVYVSAVVAEYEDGATRDVTDYAVVTTSDASVLSVDPANPNRVVANDYGDAQIVVEYRQKSETLYVTVANYNRLILPGELGFFLPGEVLWIEGTSTYLTVPDGYYEDGDIFADVLEDTEIPEHEEHLPAGDVIDFTITMYNDDVFNPIIHSVEPAIIDYQDFYILQMGYDSDEYDADDVDIYYYNEDDEEWVAQDATVDEAAGTLTLEVDSFSTYGIFAKVEDDDGDDDNGDGEDNGDQGDRNGEGDDGDDSIDDDGESSTGDDDSTEDDADETEEESTEEETPASGDDDEKLPSTATNVYNYLIAGFLLLITGVFLYVFARKRRLASQ
ncbi:GLUG motif-containing protein [Evansella tamaricis]|uniref:LPXTG cell wall anchor domain-containing protein n=1 Tax=Evansella tamaricis TaxID=2069301 RepID=A0ABS6JJ19_9BACI|nr:GLUG motif-containing protein [Evansella tamaricis]MBU9713669.1 LPXTG cell wall anchor domain-containing protein [Evansella tamaricis]